jgi:archaeal cell division control protein 6
MVFNTDRPYSPFQMDSPIFKNRGIFHKKYIPPKIIHREKQIEQVAERLKWALMGSKPKDHIIYGYGGSGKTLIARYVAEELCNRTVDAVYYYINLRESNTEVRALNAILFKLTGKTFKTSSSQSLFTRIFQYIETVPQRHIIFILDEIDKVKSGYDGFLYCLLRPHEISDTTKEITIIATSNDFKFPSELEIGTSSSFSMMDKLTFPRYNALELRDIIEHRAQEGLKEGTWNETILGLCAAYGAQEHGDARKTIELLEKAADIAMMEHRPKILEEHVKKAREQIDFEGIYSGIRVLPLHVKAIALACIKDYKSASKNPVAVIESTTSTIYNKYKTICTTKGIEALSQRRTTDILNDLATLGMINCTVKFNNPNKGKKKVIEFLIEPERVEKLITDDEGFRIFKPAMNQTTF